MSSAQQQQQQQQQRPAALLAASPLDLAAEFCLPPDVPIPCRVVDVVDGDTVRVAIVSPVTGAPAGVTVRVAGIDTPECRCGVDVSDPALQRLAGNSARSFAAWLLCGGGGCSPAAAAACLRRPGGGTSGSGTGVPAIDAAIAPCPLRRDGSVRLDISRALAAQPPLLLSLTPRASAHRPHGGLVTTYDAFGRVVGDLSLPPSAQAAFDDDDDDQQQQRQRPHTLSDALLRAGVARPFFGPDGRRQPAWQRSQLLAGIAGASRCVLVGGGGEDVFAAA